MSKDAGMDSSGEAELLRLKVELLQEELKQLRLKGEGPNGEGAEKGNRKRSNGDISDVIKKEQVGHVLVIMETTRKQ